jgi:hypothetical protein
MHRLCVPAEVVMENKESVKERLAQLHDRLRQKEQEIKSSGWKPRPDQTFYDYKM